MMSSWTLLLLNISKLSQRMFLTPAPVVPAGEVLLLPLLEVAVAELPEDEVEVDDDPPPLPFPTPFGQNSSE